MNNDWLDKHIEEQAKHYGLTKEQHNKLLRDAAKYQEEIEEGTVEEPEQSRYNITDLQ